jgi:hypothetical protein
MGRLIPAGTGMSRYRNLKLDVQDEASLPAIEEDIELAEGATPAIEQALAPDNNG